jgi:hypothetical protein
MNPAELKSQTELPKNLPQLLQAMWYDHQGNWEASHNIAQEINSREGSWVHAYLHRKEGDQSNAMYWYHLAGKNMPSITLEKEWEEIVKALLERK